MCLPFVAAAQTAEEAATAIGGFFQSYAVAGYAPHGNMKADSIRIDGEARRIDIFCNEPFSSQPFTSERLESVYKGIASCLPEPFSKISSHNDFIRKEPTAKRTRQRLDAYEARLCPAPFELLGAEARLVGLLNCIF